MSDDPGNWTGLERYDQDEPDGLYRPEPPDRNPRLRGSTNPTLWLIATLAFIGLIAVGVTAAWWAVVFTGVMVFAYAVVSRGFRR